VQDGDENPEDVYVLTCCYFAEPENRAELEERYTEHFPNGWEEFYEFIPPEHDVDETASAAESHPTGKKRGEPLDPYSRGGRGSENRPSTALASAERVVRSDYPESISSDDSLEWVEWDPVDDPDGLPMAFVGEVPGALRWGDDYVYCEDLLEFAKRRGLRVLRNRWSLCSGATDIAIDLGVGTIYHFDCSEMELVITTFLGAMPPAELDHWLDSRTPMDDLMYWCERLCDWHLRDFDDGPHVVGDPILRLENGFTPGWGVDVVHMEDGRFGLNTVAERAGERVTRWRVVDTLQEVRDLAEGQFEEQFGSVRIEPGWEQAWAETAPD
jgi:hypothetical protein